MRIILFIFPVLFFTGILFAEPKYQIHIQVATTPNSTAPFLFARSAEAVLRVGAHSNLKACDQILEHMMDVTRRLDLNIWRASVAFQTSNPARGWIPPTFGNSDLESLRTRLDIAERGVKVFTPARLKWRAIDSENGTQFSIQLTDEDLKQFGELKFIDIDFVLRNGWWDQRWLHLRGSLNLNTGTFVIQSLTENPYELRVGIQAVRQTGTGNSDQ